MTNWEKLYGSPEKMARNKSVRARLCADLPNQRCSQCKYNIGLCGLRRDASAALEWLQEEAADD